MDFEINIKINENYESFKKLSGEANNLQRSIAISELETIKLILLKDNAKSNQEVAKI